MYPWIRFAREMIRARRLGPLAPGEVHRTTLICWPWDIDVQMEMNNGRILTLFDVGRVPMFWRTGAVSRMQKLGWYGTIAGSAIRYRRRCRTSRASASGWYGTAAGSGSRCSRSSSFGPASSGSTRASSTSSRGCSGTATARPTRCSAPRSPPARASSRPPR